MERIDDAPHSAEEPDKGGDIGDRREPGDALFHDSERLTGSSLRSSFESGGILRHAAPAALALILIVNLSKDGDKRRGLELLGDGGDFAQAARFSESPKETRTLHPCGAEGSVLRKDDGPGEDACGGEQDQDAKRDRPGIVQDFDDGRRWGRQWGRRGRKVFLQQREGECGK